MKKYLFALLAVAALSAPASAASPAKKPVAQPPSLVRCAVWVAPVKGCTDDERIGGGTILTAAVGLAVSAIFPPLWIGLAVGAATGFVGATVVK